MNLRYLEFSSVKLDDGVILRPIELSGGDSDIVHRKNESTLRSYKEIFSSCDINVKSLFEIGVCGGGSLIMWNLVFGCKVVGIDVVDSVPISAKKYMEFRPITFQIMDSRNISDVERCVDIEFPSGLDIIVDDGSHCIEEIKYSVYHLFKFLKHGGLYFIEDWKALHDIHRCELYEFLNCIGHSVDTHHNFILLRKM